MTGAAPAVGADAGLTRLVVARGAASGLLLGVIPSLISTVLSAQDPKPQASLALTYVLVVAGFVVAGLVAANEAGHQPTRHAVVAAVLAWVPVQVIGVLGRLDRGDGVSVPAIVLLLLFAVAGGSLGAKFGVSLRARRLRKEQPS